MHLCQSEGYLCIILSTKKKKLFFSHQNNTEPYETSFFLKKCIEIRYNNKKIEIQSFPNKIIINNRHESEDLSNMATDECNCLLYLMKQQQMVCDILCMETRRKICISASANEWHLGR